MSSSKTLSMSAVMRLTDQDPPVPAEEAAAQLGVSQDAYRVARNIAYLWREDLTVEEWAKVSDAIKLISEVQVTAAREMIEDVMFRHFGDTRTSHHGGPPKAREAATREFLRASAALTDSMRAAASISVPFLPEAEREPIVQDLLQGIDNIESLIRAIEQGGTHNVRAD